MSAVDAIVTKRNKQKLPDSAIREFVRAAVDGRWEDYQLSAMLMAIYLNGMSAEEVAVYTREMTDSGERIDLSDIPGPKIDKHSTGGVGDKTSLILAPLAAACGVVVPMMSGRGLGHTGGTLDKLEAIPGYRVNLSIEEFKRSLRSNGMAMMGQTKSVAPADKKLYALRDVTGTVESIPLITGSILSKKIAEGISGLVLDVKAGQGAFMKKLDDAKLLAKSLVSVAKANGLECMAYLTRMDQPLGVEVGNANEVIECIRTLQGEGPKDLEQLSVILAAKMVYMAKKAATMDEAETMVRKAISDGSGLERFRKNIEEQGGEGKVVDNFSHFTQVTQIYSVRAVNKGYIHNINAEIVGIAAMRLGAGRQKFSDNIDHAVGITLRAKIGDLVSKNDVIFEVRYRDSNTLSNALEHLNHCFELSEQRPPSSPVIIEEVYS